jgi:hypothetical protein
LNKNRRDLLFTIKPLREGWIILYLYLMGRTLLSLNRDKEIESVEEKFTLKVAK